MLLQFNEKLWRSLVKRRGLLVLSDEAQKEVLRRCKNVRSCDYVARFDVKNGVAESRGVVTRANWLFILTNIACFWEGADAATMPRVALNFPYYCPSSPFSTKVEDWGAVPCSLVLGREGLNGKNDHFEEYKDLFYILDQRFSVKLDVKADAGQYVRGSVMLSGLEVNLGGM